MRYLADTMIGAVVILAFAAVSTLLTLLMDGYPRPFQILGSIAAVVVFCALVGKYARFEWSQRYK